MAYILSLGKANEGGVPMPAGGPASGDAVAQGKELVTKKNCLFCHVMGVEKPVAPVEAAPVVVVEAEKKNVAKKVVAKKVVSKKRR